MCICFVKGFLQAETKNSIPVHCVYDNEEVGSETKQGAASTFYMIRCIESMRAWKEMTATTTDYLHQVLWCQQIMHMPYIQIMQDKACPD